MAFVQAKAAPGTCIGMPKLFEQQGNVFELKQNSYGMCEAPRDFYCHLKKWLEDHRLTASPHDHYLFMSKGLIIITYVDNCIFFAWNDKVIEDLISSLCKTPPDQSKVWDNFILNKEEDHAGFLGIDISSSKHVKGKIELLQVGHIDQMLNILNLDKENVHTQSEPASMTP